MTTVSAPGKVYLFGEHAVVYGEPAVPCAIEKRATVTAELRDDDHIRVEAADLSLNGFVVEYAGSTADRPDVDVPQPLLDAAMGYIDARSSRPARRPTRPTQGSTSPSKARFRSGQASARRPQ